MHFHSQPLESCTKLSQDHTNSKDNYVIGEKMCEFHKRIVDLMCAIKLDFRGNKCRSLHLQPLEVKVGSFKSVALMPNVNIAHTQNRI